MKKSWIIAVGAAGLVLLLIFMIPALLDINKYRGEIEAKASATLGRPVKMGAMKLSFLPPSFTAQTLEIAESPPFPSGRPFARTNDVHVAIELFPLFSGRIVVTSIALRQPQLELVRDSAGNWNYATLGSASSRAPAGTSSTPDNFTLGELAITDATVGITDLGKRTREVFTHIDLTMKDYAHDTPFSLALAAQLPGGVPVKMAGKVHLALATGRIQLIDTKLRLAGSSLNLAGAINLKAATPALEDVHLWTNDFAAEDAIRAAKALGVELAPGMNVAGKVSADLKASGPLTKPQLNGKVGVSSLEASGNGLAEPVKISALDVALTPEQARSNAFQVTSGNTTLNTQFTLYQYASPSPSIDASVNTPGAVLNSLLGIARAYGVKGLEGFSGDGTLTLDLRAAGPVANLSGNSVTQTLNGQARLNFSNIHVPGVDLNDAVSSITKLGGGGGSVRKDYTSLSRVTGDIQVNKGMAQTGNLAAVFDMGNVTASGTANLVTQALNLNVLAKLNAQFSSAAGAAGSAGSLLNSALRGSNGGGLEVPIIVTGTFNNPHYTPDVQKMAKSKLGGAAGGILGRLTGSGGSPTSKDLGSMLGGLLEKKKKK